MIAFQELRIGNWVTNDTSGKYYCLKTGADIDSAGNFQLIPITPELLKSCGFNYDNYFKYWQKNKAKSGTGPDMELDPDYWVLDFSHQRIGVELKGLHQLQNLYFLLKGKELEVNIDLFLEKSDPAQSYLV
jgi:hypothetical protein